MNEGEFPAIFDLIRWSENLNHTLDLIKQDFGPTFIRDIFNRKIKVDRNYNLLLYISWIGENLPDLLKWLRLNFTNDLKFLEKQIYSSLETGKYGIMHIAFSSLSNPTLLKLLDEIENWEHILGKDTVKKLCLMEEAENYFFLYFYSRNKTSNTDCLIEILNKIQLHFESEETFLAKIIFHGQKFFKFPMSWHDF